MTSTNSGDWRPSLGAGCQCKVPGLALHEIVEEAYKSTNALTHPMSAAEDSALVADVPSQVLLSCDLATVMGFDPEVDGRIAVLHALSDIYASGGIPTWGLSLLVLPTEGTVDYGIALLKGMLDAAANCKTAIIGGQTIRGTDAMAGMAVMGYLRSSQPMRKKAAVCGEHIYLSKPLGTSLAIHARNVGCAPKNLVDEAYDVLTLSNESASREAVSAGVRACTDVSGFGLLGHICQLLSDSVGALLRYEAIPLIAGLDSVPEAIVHAPWLKENYEYAASIRGVDARIDARRLAPLVDPQTNGGLLVTAAANNKALLDAGFRDIGAVIGERCLFIES